MAFLKHIIPKQILWLALPMTGFAFGRFLDQMETERLSLFRDKSALYGRVLEEGEKPSWP